MPKSRKILKNQQKLIEIELGTGVGYSRLQTNRGLIMFGNDMACSGKGQVKILCGWNHG